MRKVRENNFETKMEMTPLIDCVFLLIMFFILTTQITVKIEDVTLPFAEEGKQADPEDTTSVALVINVPRDETATQTTSRRGKIVYEGDRLNAEELHRVLLKEVAYDAAPKPRGRGRAKEPGPGELELSQLEVLIRYDKDVQAEHLRTIFQECQKVGIYKLKLATMPPDVGN